jgi:hypothetical protein
MWELPSRLATAMSRKRMEGRLTLGIGVIFPSVADDVMWTGISSGAGKTKVLILRVSFEGPDGAIGQGIIDGCSVNEDSMAVTQASLCKGGGA